MNTNEYYDLLKNQYYESICNNPDKLLSHIGYKDFNKELLNWLKKRQIIAKKYVEFLKNYGYDITTLETAEVEKGKYDTVVDNFNTTVITPYFYPESEENENKKILRYSFLPNSDIPGLLSFDKNGNLQEIISTPGYISRFITENPYKRTDLYGFEDLCNNYDIIVGMYGDINDSDMQIKLNFLKKLKDKLINNEIELKYDVESNYYFAMLACNKRIKTKKKVR